MSDEQSTARRRSDALTECMEAAKDLQSTPLMRPRRTRVAWIAMKLFLTCAVVVSAFVPVPGPQVPACSLVRRDVRAAAWRGRGGGNEKISFGKYQGKSFAWIRREDPEYCAHMLERPTKRSSDLAAFQSFLRSRRQVKATARRPQPIYHYTDTASAKKILGSGVLKPSLKKDGDAFYGDGVYFTSKPQTTGYKELHENNYDGSRKRRGQEAYVTVDRNKVPGLVQVDDAAGRDVLVARRSRPLDLSEVGGFLQWKRGAKKYPF